MLCFGIYRFKREGYRTRTCIICKQIAGTGIGIHATDGASSARYIPGRRAYGQVGKHGRMPNACLCLLFPCHILFLNNGKQRVSPITTPVQPAIKAHPFSTAKGRRLHIISTLNNGYSHLIYTAIAATVLKRRQQQSIGLEVNHALHIRTLGIAQIHHTAIGQALQHLLLMDILGIAHTGHTIQRSPFVHQTTVHRGVDDRTLQRHTYHRPLG